MNKPIHPAVAEHVMQENEKLRGLMRDALPHVASSCRAHNDRLINEIDAALSQQAEPAPAQDELVRLDKQCRDDVAAALGFTRGGDFAWSYLLSQISECVRLDVTPPDARPAQTEHQPYMWVRVENNHIEDYTQDANLAEIWLTEDWPVTMPLYAAPIAQPEQSGLYTCIGKGGVYELIGRATTAGVLKVTGRFADEVIVYRDTESNALYCREPGDFRLRMARASLPTQNPKP